MRRIVAIAAVAALAFLCPRATSASNPDFVYPIKVETQARKDLAKALKRHDEQQALRSLIDFAMAKCAIDPDSASIALAEMRTVRAKVSSHAAIALTNLLIAITYSQLYQSNRWIYDSRTLPPNSPTGNYLEWDEKMFRLQITTLVDSAIALAPALHNVALESWCNVITAKQATLLRYPTLDCFVYAQAAKLLESQQTADVYARWISATASNPAALITAKLAQISSEYVANATDSLTQIYEHFSQLSPCSADALLLSYRINNSPSLHHLINDALQRWPQYDAADKLRAIIAAIENPSVTVSTPQCVAPMLPTELEVTLGNLACGQLMVYRIPDSHPLDNTSYESSHLNLTELIGSIDIKSSLALPFSTTQTPTFTFPREGRYVINLHADEIEPVNRPLPIIYCTRLALAATSFDKTIIFTLDPADGSPITGATITNHGNNSASLIGLTGPDGLLANTPAGSGRLTAQLGQSLTPPTWIGITSWQPDSTPIADAKIFTSLPLYHLGDTIQWCAVCYNRDYYTRSVLTHTEAEMTLYDANGQKCAAHTGTTDDFGLLSGQFVMPTDGLTGRFRLCLKLPGNHTATRWITVSDYKLPTFEIQLDKPSTGRESAVISGTAKAYSGFPLAEAQVELQLQALEPWRWWSAGNAATFHTANTITDADGYFSFSIDSATLNLSPNKSKLYNASLKVTSATGETQSATCHFALRKAYRILLDIEPSTLVIDDSLPLNLSVLDFDGGNAQVDLSYSIVQHGDTLRSGTLPSHNPSINLSNIPSGETTLYLSHPNASQLTTSTILYRDSDTKSPVDAPIWTPLQRLTLDHGKGTLLVGAHRETRLLLQTASKTKLLTQRWIELQPGMHTVNVEIPDTLISAQALLFAISGYQQSTIRLTLDNPSAQQQIRITTETFRDKIIPGTPQSWTFRITPGCNAAAVADIRSKAVDALERADFSFIPKLKSGVAFSRQSSMANNKSSASFIGPNRRYWPEMTEAPDFNFYNLGLLSTPIIRQHKGRINMMTGEMTTMTTATSADSDVAFAEAANDVDKDSGTIADESYDDTFSYRDSEMPLALFNPSLRSAPDGSLEITFTAPESNTTWMLDIVAWTKSIISTTFNTEVIASKPLMVQPNLPRFIRTADRITIPAIVMNNSNHTQTITVTTELFNPADNSIIITSTHTLDIEACQSATTSIEATGPDNLTQLGYRIKASCEAGSDGEQSLLPIISSATQVTESIPFWITPGQESFTMALPDNEGINNTLEFCTNPLYAVVQTLPKLQSPAYESATTAARAIFSAAVAQGLSSRYPEIGQALAMWRDDTNVEDLYRQQIASLKKLATSDGGLIWSHCSATPSAWATSYFLLCMGKLNTLGFMPETDELHTLTINALKWLDRHTATNYHRNPDGDYIAYTYIRSLFPALPHDDDSQAVCEATVNRLAREWHSLTIAAKPTAALILATHGHQSEAANIVESLRQYAVTSIDKGMWWPSLTGNVNLTLEVTSRILEAFHAVDPGNLTDINAIRQWLVLQKQALDWGDEASTSAVIAAILCCSNSWHSFAGDVEVFVDNKSVNTGSVSPAIGSFTAQLPSPGHLKITGLGEFPSWGTVISSYQADVTNIEAVSCQALSIEKRIYRIDGGNAAEIDGNVPLGATLRIQLLVKADRDIDYVVISDQRASLMEPVDQLPAMVWCEGLALYRESCDTTTNFLIDRLPRGTYLLSYDVYARSSGDAISGIATIQSEYAPLLTAHSAALHLTVR